MVEKTLHFFVALLQPCLQMFKEFWSDCVYVFNQKIKVFVEYLWMKHLNFYFGSRFIFRYVIAEYCFHVFYEVIIFSTLHR